MPMVILGKHVFSVIFEMQLEPQRDAAYFDRIMQLRSSYQNIRGFLEHSLLRSLRRPSVILSVSRWRDEKSLVRWRVNEEHHRAQLMARSSGWTDYRLRVGQVTRDTALGDQLHMVNQRLDETAIEGGTLTLISGRNHPAWIDVLTAGEAAHWLGFDPAEEPDCVQWDIFQNVDAPAELMLVASWRSHRAADAFSAIGLRPECARFERIRVIRDYGMNDRREAPQYFPDIAGRLTLHA